MHIRILISNDRRNVVPSVRLSTVSSRVFTLLLVPVSIEHPAGREDISTITEAFLSTSENLAFQTILS